MYTGNIKENFNGNNEEIRKLIKTFNKNKIYFLLFGNTEYPGAITYDKLKNNFVFKTIREGMEKRFNIDVAQKLVKDGNTRDFWL